MITSDRQSVAAWQVKTKEGVCYQPESISILYQWIVDNRIGAEDFIFNPSLHAWVPIIDAPELKNCFWQLLTEGGVIYGPVSLGEAKQLFLNGQITEKDKVSIYGLERWCEIKNLPSLGEWLTDADTQAADYSSFVDKLTKEFETNGYIPKEEKITKKLRALEAENKGYKKQIKELDTARERLEKEIKRETAEIEKISNGAGEQSRLLESVQTEVKNLRSELKEKAIVLEELNKHMAQKEVTGALKDGEMSELRSLAESMKAELEKANNEKTKIQQSMPAAVKELNEKIRELEYNILNKDKLLDESNNAMKEITWRNTDLGQKINSLQSIISEKDGTLSEFMARILRLKESNNASEKRLREFDETLPGKDGEIEKYREESSRLRGELEEKENAAGEFKNSVETSLRLKEDETLDFKNTILRNENEIAGYKDRLSNIESKLREKDSEISNVAQLNYQIDDLNKEIIGYEQKAKELNSIMGGLEKTLLEKDVDIAGLNNKINEIKQNAEEYYRDEEKKIRDEIQAREKTITGLNGELDNIKEAHKRELDELSRSLDEKNSAIADLGKENADINDEKSRLLTEAANLKNQISGLEGDKLKKENVIGGLRLDLENLQKEYKSNTDGLNKTMIEKDAVIERLSKEKDGLSVEIVSQKQGFEEVLRIESDKFKEEIDKKENTINELKVILFDLEKENKLRIVDLEDKISAQKAQFGVEAQDKDRQWEETLKNSKEEWAKEKETLESILAQKDAGINNGKAEVERLQDALILQGKKLKEQMDKAKEEAEILRNSFEKQKEDIKAEFSQKESILRAKIGEMELRITESEKSRTDAEGEIDALRGKVKDKEQLMSSIRDGAKRDEELYKARISDINSTLRGKEDELSALLRRVDEISGQLQSELKIQEGLKRDLSLANEDLNNTKMAAGELQKEKDAFIREIETTREESAKDRALLARDLEEAKRTLTHTEEESRNIQKQLYQEKQKLSKEYTETISKMERLNKRGQLEREIQDRQKMKEELERLHNILKTNFEGLQKGAEEMQQALESLNSDMDEKRLSLKYVSEFEKREGRKPSLLKIESSEETNPI